MNAFHRHRRSSAPAAVYRLDTNQQCLVTAMRQWAETCAITSAVAEPLFRLFGIYYIEVALEAFETLMQVLTDLPGSPPALLPPGSGQVSRGEQAVLRLVAAFQAGEPAVAHASAGVLTSPHNRRQLLAAASVLAETLEARRILFRQRDDKPLALMAVVGRG